MLARLQQLTTLALVALAALWAWLFWRAGHPAWAPVGVLLILAVYAAVLGIEFLLVTCLNRRDPAPRARAWQLVRAWWGEVCSGPQVFCWRQPFLSLRWPDHLPSSSKGQRGVVLIHGFICNRGLWNPWMQRLRQLGVPHVAVNLEPVFGSIDDYVQVIDQAVSRLRESTGLPPVVVAHSMGGLALRRWWVERADDSLLHHVVTLGTPHHGTWMARWAFSANGRQMRRGSAWLRALVERESPQRRARFTCFYSHCDNIVAPASTAMLADADNRHLSGVAHVHMSARPEPLAEALRWLQRPDGQLSPS